MSSACQQSIQCSEAKCGYWQNNYSNPRQILTKCNSKCTTDLSSDIHLLMIFLISVTETEILAWNWKQLIVAYRKFAAWQTERQAQMLSPRPRLTWNQFYTGSVSSSIRRWLKQHCESAIYQMAKTTLCNLSSNLNKLVAIKKRMQDAHTKNSAPTKSS